MAGVGVLLDVVLDAGALERGLELRRGALAARGRARRSSPPSGRRRVSAPSRSLRQRAVVRRRGVEAARGGEQREAAAHAEPDHADLAGAVLARGELAADGLDVVERLAAARRAAP